MASGKTTTADTFRGGIIGRAVFWLLTFVTPNHHQEEQENTSFDLEKQAASNENDIQIADQRDENDDFDQQTNDELLDNNQGVEGNTSVDSDRKAETDYEILNAVIEMEILNVIANAEQTNDPSVSQVENSPRSVLEIQGVESTSTTTPEVHSIEENLPEIQTRGSAAVQQCTYPYLSNPRSPLFYPTTFKRIPTPLKQLKKSAMNIGTLAIGSSMAVIFGIGQAVSGFIVNQWTRIYILMPCLSLMCASYLSGVALCIVSMMEGDYPKMKSIMKGLLWFTAATSTLGTLLGCVCIFELVI